MTTTDRYLKDICELLIDSKLGYSETSKRTDDPRLMDLLNSISHDRIGKISTLSNKLEDRGVKPPRSGTFKGTLHRVWIAMRDVILNTDDVNMVSECLKGEAYLVGRVDEALKHEEVDQEVKGLLKGQREMLMANLDHIQSLDLAMTEG